MPTVNPTFVVWNALQGLTKNPAFASLSSEAQAALQQQVRRGASAPLQTNDPALKAALAEARAKGLLDNSPLWQDVLKATGLTLAGAIAGPALVGALTPGAGAAGAAGSAGAGSAAAGSAAAGTSAADTGAFVGPTLEQAGIAAPISAASGLNTMVGPTMEQAGFVPKAVAASTPSLLHDLLPSIIGAGAGVGGAAIVAHANTEAAKIQAETAAKALAVQQQQYALQRQDTAPYRALGQGAVNNLGYLGGIDTTSNLAALSSTAPAIPSGTNPSENLAPVVALGAKDASGQPIPTAGLNQTIPRPPTPAQQGLSALSQPASSGTVRIQDPATGLVHLIPQAQASAAQQAGGRLV